MINFKNRKLLLSTILIAFIILLILPSCSKPSSEESIINEEVSFDYNLEFNSNHPYNRNNGTMIPNRGYQHVFSPGLYAKIGPLEITLKPEHHFAENKNFEGFWQGHRDVVWERRYNLWNRIDIPEKFGNQNHNST